MVVDQIRGEGLLEKIPETTAAKVNPSPMFQGANTPEACVTAIPAAKGRMSHSSGARTLRLGREVNNPDVTRK
jgi:hypothetical protein